MNPNDIARAPRKRGRPPARTSNRPPKRDSTKSLGLDYKRILRHSGKLERMGLLQSERKKKYILALTFDGFHIYLQNTFIQEPNSGAKHLDEAITANAKFLPFAKYWNEIDSIVGKNVAHRGVEEAVQQQIFRYPVNIGEINFRFDSFLTKHKPTFPKISKRNQDIELADFVSRSPELRNSYIAYLAVHDIFYLTSQERWSERELHLGSLESERALAFFERRNIDSKPLFMSRARLEEFFPKFATIECFFTGLLMEKLLR